MSRRSLSLVLALAALTRASAQTQAGASSSPSDPYLWLEDQRGARAMAWVATENAKTSGVLEKDPRFAPAVPRRAGDRAGERSHSVSCASSAASSTTSGRTARTCAASGAARRWRAHRTASPQWTTVLDLDSLAQGGEGELGVGRRRLRAAGRATVPAQPVRRRRRRRDGARIRPRHALVRPKAGFVLPHGKQSVAWVGEDTLLVSREWNPGELTASGYPFIVKRLVRGQPLTDGRRDLPRRFPKDVCVGPASVFDGDRPSRRTSCTAASASSNREVLWRRHVRTSRRLDFRSSRSSSAMVDGQVIVQLSRGLERRLNAHSLRGRSRRSTPRRPRRDPTHLSPMAVFEPGPRESVGRRFGDARSAASSRMYRERERPACSSSRAPPTERGRAQPFDLPDNVSSCRRSATDPHGTRRLRLRRGLSHAEQCVARRCAPAIGRRG